MVRIVMFDNSARYDLPGSSDDDDVNKLFGFGFFPSHKKESARFGWNWNIGSSKVNLFAYCYVDGLRVMKKICEVMVNRRIKLSLDIIGKIYGFTVTDAINDWHLYGGLDIKFNHRKKLGYGLGCYFGGTQPAPHTIRIEMSEPPTHAKR
jgi:hypothetical protein